MFALILGPHASQTFAEMDIELCLNFVMTILQQTERDVLKTVLAQSLDGPVLVVLDQQLITVWNHVGTAIW